MEVTFKSFAPLNPEDAPGPRILIVDDDHKSMVTITELLREVNAKISIANSGLEALEWFYNETPLDLVILDLYMPDMNGFKTFDAIRKTEWFRSHRVPVIAMSSNMLAEPKAQFLRTTGFRDYATKPLRREQFLTMIKKHAPHGDTGTWF